jgi:hypothetical protein
MFYTVYGQKNFVKAFTWKTAILSLRKGRGRHCEEAAQRGTLSRPQAAVILLQLWK